MIRVVRPELLDSLPPDKPQAVASRADLRRLNWLMGHAGILFQALQSHLAALSLRSRSLRMVELGSGDGSLFLRLARRMAALDVRAEATLLDRQDSVLPETRRALTALAWSVQTVASDVFAWAEQPFPEADVILANLFLHHFSERSLAELLRQASAKTKLFIACEPRRSPLALTAARLLRLTGCNAVTCHDAVVSVRAGFAGRELSACWPAGPQWLSHERPAGLFSHLFIAQRHG